MPTNYDENYYENYYNYVMARWYKLTVEDGQGNVKNEILIPEDILENKDSKFKLLLDE